MTSLAMGFDHLYSIRHEFLPVGPHIQSKELLIILINSHVIIAPLATLCLAGQYCSMWGPALGKPIDVSPHFPSILHNTF